MASHLRQVRKRRAAAGFPPGPAFCPWVLARPGGASRPSSGGPDRAPVRALPTDGPVPSPIPPVAASVLALGHSAPRPWCGGDGFPADPPANGALVGGARRHRLSGRARRTRTGLRCHAAAVAASTLPPGAPTGEGEVLLFSLHNYRIVASFGLDKLFLVAVGVVVDTGAGPNLVRWSALAPDWLRQVVTSRERSRSALETPTTRGYVPAVQSRCGSRRGHGSSL